MHLLQIGNDPSFLNVIDGGLILIYYFWVNGLNYRVSHTQFVFENEPKRNLEVERWKKDFGNIEMSKK